MKVLSTVLKIIETLIVCVFGVFFGTVFPACILAFGEEIIPADIASEKGPMIVWLVTSIIGYVLSAALIFTKRYKSAALLSMAGFIGVLIVNGSFTQLYRYTENSNGPSFMYLPLIFATILDIIIAVIENRDKIMLMLEKRRDEENAPAPSILADDNKKK